MRNATASFSDNEVMRRLPSLLLSVALICASVAHATPCSELPVLYLVQDKSGTMSKAPDGTTATTNNPSKWSSAAAVVPALANQFANRFRFGLTMFPASTTQFNCDVGGVVAGVPASANDVQADYTANVPGGGTPTAATLDGVRTYLQSLHLTTAASVLLITDGLPNCNLSLNVNTCAPSEPACAGGVCGAKGCLDDQGAIAAAGRLKAAGFQVFVVGFDSTLTSGNNKAVLDAMAAAGGTGSAYVAANQAALSQVLDTIAVNTTTCCQDVCTAGAQQCNGAGQQQTCQLDASIGCTTWKTSTCGAMSSCTNGSCVACQNACTAGATQCSASGNAQTCQTGTNGCTSWVTTTQCGYGELCSGGACSSCTSCSIGSSRCNGTGTQSCEWDLLSGCTAWTDQPCASGSVCASGSCQACNGTCTAGAARCTGKNAELCVADASGCTSWQTLQTCTSFCSGGACGTCGTSCTVGDTRCNGNATETCGTDVNGCSTWSATTACASEFYCAAGACQQCATTCTAGTKRCALNGATEVCTLDAATGCHGWAPSTQCNLAAGEHCDLGVCIPPCQNACTQGAGRCTGGAPQSCTVAGTGCTVWSDQTACDANSLCQDGTCFTKCANDELKSCPDGFICTGTTTGDLCMPVTDGGASGTGGGSGSTGGGLGTGTGGGSGTGTGGGAGAGAGAGSGVDGGDGGGAIGAKAGCACTSFDGALFPMLGLAMLALRRRQVR